MNATSTITVEHLHTIFATHGLPEMLVSNNGSVFTSAELSDFVKHNDIWYVKSASYYAASNGLAERAAQTFKVFMKKSTAGTIHTRASHFLSQYRITPHSTAGVTPAEILFGHWPRTRLDLLRLDISNRVQSRQQSQKSHHDQRARERRFQTGDTVSIQTILGYLEWLKSKLYHEAARWLQGSSTLWSHIGSFRNRNNFSSRWWLDEFTWSQSRLCHCTVTEPREQTNDSSCPPLRHSTRPSIPPKWYEHGYGT